MKWILSSPTRFYGSALVALAVSLFLAVGAASLRLASFEEPAARDTPGAARPSIAPGDAEVIRRLRPPVEIAVEEVGTGVGTVVVQEGVTTLVDVATPEEVCTVEVTRGEAEVLACTPA